MSSPRAERDPTILFTMPKRGGSLGTRRLFGSPDSGFTCGLRCFELLQDPNSQRRQFDRLILVVVIYEGSRAKLRNGLVRSRTSRCKAPGAAPEVEALFGAASWSQ